MASRVYLSRAERVGPLFTLSGASPPLSAFTLLEKEEEIENKLNGMEQRSQASPIFECCNKQTVSKILEPFQCGMKLRRKILFLSRGKT